MPIHAQTDARRRRLGVALQVCEVLRAVQRAVVDHDDPPASAFRSIDAARTSVTVVAVEARGQGSKIDSSPNMSDGPMRASRCSRPSGEQRPILTFPERTMYSRSPGSPWLNTVCPRPKVM